MGQYPLSIWVLFFLAPLAHPQTPPVHLLPTPQKFRTFHKLEDAVVPPALKAPLQLLPAGATAAALATDGAIWQGSERGVTRIDPNAQGWDRIQYMAGKRYLPDDKVVALAPDAAAGMWVRTETGVSHIELRPMTLAEKAAYFEERVRLRHDRHGMVAGCRLREPGNLATFENDPSDNDGLWTAIYTTAEWFRYAVTGSQDALARAVKTTEAILFLEQVTGRPGFPARSMVVKGERPSADGMWHWTPDGKYQFKGDTSSDEIVGHFYVFAVAWDLAPPGSPLRRRVAETCARVMDHIIEHGYHLTDITGYPTYWGRWSPAYFASSRGRPDSPLNALELLSFLKTAHHITGAEKYAAEYRKVALDMGYARLTTQLLELREELNYSDEELAFLPFYLLFRYETDPQLLTLYRQALDAWWVNARREKNPLWTIIYILGKPQKTVDLAGAVNVLHRLPMDLVNWATANSHRRDFLPEGEKDRFGRVQSKTLLAPDERPVMKWNGNPFQVDGGGQGTGEDDGAAFLLPYWMGRYHKLLLGE